MMMEGKTKRGFKGEEAHYAEIMSRLTPEIDALEQHINRVVSDTVKVRVAIASLKVKAMKTAHEMFVSELRVMLGSE